MDWKTRLPGLSGDSDIDMKRVLDYSFQLSEEIRYYLNNLDMSNFNQVEWATYENGLLQIAVEGMTVLISDAEKRLSVKWEADIEGFKSTVESYEETVDGYTKEVTGYKQQVSSFNQTVDGFNTTVRSYEKTLSGYKDQVSTYEQTVNGFKTTVGNYEKTVSGYTQQVSSYEQTASKIALMVSSVDDADGNVTAASIVAAINKAGSSVKIAADHVNISGLVTVSDLEGNGTVEINAGNIAAGGTISGVGFVSESEDWAGERYLEIVDGTIYFEKGSIYGDADFGISIKTTWDLSVTGDIVYITSDDTTWRLTSTGWEKWQ